MAKIEGDQPYSLTAIYITSGVSAFTGEPFCLVEAEGTDGKFSGQLDPATVRGMALGWLEAAEAAVSDAAVYAMLTKDVGLDDDTALQTIASLRRHRCDGPEPS